MLISNPSLTDVTQITGNITGLHTLSMFIALPLAGILFPLEAIRQNMQGMAEGPQYTDLFLRTILVFTGLILYRTIFNFIVHSSFIVEHSILSMGQAAALIGQMETYTETHRVSFLTGVFPICFCWAMCFMVLVFKAVLEWVRYALLGALYVAGPIAFVTHLFGPTRHVAGAWFKEVIEVSLWTVVLKLLLRILLELHVQTVLTSANQTNDILTLIGVSVTLIVMIWQCTKYTSHFIASGGFGAAMGTLASSHMARRGMDAAKSSVKWTLGHDKQEEREPGSESQGRTPNNRARTVMGSPPTRGSRHD
jgi:hypothetical protein